MNLYAQALTALKRATHLLVVETIRPTTGTPVVPLCSPAEEAESVSARFNGAAYRNRTDT
jgi:hypothetical protein